MPPLLRVLCLACLLAPPLLAQDARPDVVVSSRATHAVLRFDGDTGAYVGDFVAPGAGGLNLPQEVRFHANGDLLVTGRFNTAVLRFDGQTGEFVGLFTSGYALQEPTKMTFGPNGLLYVSQWGGQFNKVVRFDGETGAFVDEFTSTDLNQGMGHTWDGEGNLYVAAFGSRDVRRGAPDGTFLDVFTDADLLGPVNLWFGEGGDLFVQDWQAGEVRRFDRETGIFLETFVSGMARSEGFAFGEGGLLYACDWQQNHVNRYDAVTGAFVDRFVAGSGLIQPNSLAFMPTSPVPAEPPPTSAPAKLGQSFPNPAAESAVIRYVLDEGGAVVLKVFDLTGREVATLVDGFRPAGAHEVVFERGALPSGLYVYRLVAGVGGGVGVHAESGRVTLAR